MLYASADVAFVGGSLVPVGGHNLLEPASLGLPVLAGPHLGNTLEVAERLRAAHALRVVNDARELGIAVGELLDDPNGRREMGRRALDVVAASRGAVARVVAVIEPFVTASSSTPASVRPA
jgi:3-deoxy-D-manno-octulosonic-acid transferase